MDRRDFIKLSSTGIIGMTLGGELITKAADAASTAESAAKAKGSSYDIVILGDTHFDQEPSSRYHTGYSDPNPTREANHRVEFGKYEDMWKDRSPRLVKRAACLVDDNTKMVFQMGDIIQGDTGSAETHRQYLDDAYSYLKEAMGPLPLITVIGNHDLRSWDDKTTYQVYRDYMPARMSAELGKEITKTTFAFTIGEDAYIFVDFNKPDDEELEKLMKETEGARYTFICVHGPLFPYDSTKYYNWFFHGRDKSPEARRRWREIFAKRNVIAICGHTHTNEFMDWYGDGGRITQLTTNSVWSKEEYGTYKVDAEGAEEYGALRIKAAQKKGTEVPAEQTALFDEFRPGIKEYIHSAACGSYKLHVSPKGVTVDFYAGDSTRVSAKYKLR